MPRTEPPTPAGRARYRRRRPGTVAVAVTVIGAAAVAVVAASGCRQGRRDPIATTPTPPDAGADARAPATPEPVAVGVRDPEALVSVAGLVRPRIDGPVRVTPGVPLVLPAEVATRDDAGRLANLPPPPHRLDGVSARDGRVHPFEVRWYDFVTDDRAGAGAARWLPGGTTGVRVTEWTRAPRRAEMPERLQPVLVGRLDETTRDGDVLRFGATEVEVLPPAPGAAGWPLAEGGYRDAVVAAPAFGPEARHLRPDPDAPDEAPRRWLLAVHADRPGLAAGGLEFDERGGFASVLARTMAAGFAEGLARLDLRSPGTADALRAAWTRTLRDGTTEFAAWPSDTWLEMSRIHDLVTTPWPAARGLEAAPDVATEDRLLAILQWLERFPPVLAWIESAGGPAVHLAVANAAPVSEIVRISWVTESGSSLAVPDLVREIPPGVVRRERLPRPESVDEADRDRLRIRIRTERRPTFDLAPGPASVEVRPPGIALRPWAGNWTLPAWLEGRPEPIALRDTVLLQRAGTHWELYLELVGEGAEAAAGRAEAMPTSQPERVEGPEATGDEPEAPEAARPTPWPERPAPIAMTGLDAVTLLVGPAEEPRAVVSVGPGGRTHWWTGDGEAARAAGFAVAAGTSGRGAMLRRRLRVTLPTTWTADGMLDLGLVRTTSAVPDRLLCWPRPALPWRGDPGRMRFDLGEWDDPIARPPGN